MSCISSIRRWYSNPRPHKHESSPITTRPLICPLLLSRVQLISFPFSWFIPVRSLNVNDWPSNPYHHDRRDPRMLWCSSTGAKGTMTFGRMTFERAIGRVVLPPIWTTATRSWQVSKRRIFSWNYAILVRSALIGWKILNGQSECSKPGWRNFMHGNFLYRIWPIWMVVALAQMVVGLLWIQWSPARIQTIFFARR